MQRTLFNHGLKVLDVRLYSSCIWKSLHWELPKYEAHSITETLRIVAKIPVEMRFTMAAWRGHL